MAQALRAGREAEPGEVANARCDRRPTLTKLQKNHIFKGILEYCSIAAIVISGIWTYLKFIRSRIYRPRLKASVSDGTVSVDGQPHLVVDLGMKNAPWNISWFEKHGWIETGEGIQDQLLIRLPLEDSIIAIGPINCEDWGAAIERSERRQVSATHVRLGL